MNFFRNMIFFCVLVVAGTISAATIDQELELYGFADYLFKNGDYYRSITEYKRYLFFYPDSQRSLAVKLNIGRAYYSGEKFSSAEQVFVGLSAATGMTGLTQLYLADIFYRRKNYKKSEELYTAAGRELGLKKIADYRNAWNFIGTGNYLKAYNYLSLFFQNNPEQEWAENSGLILNNLKELLEFRPKKRSIAMLLAIIPGFGQFYSRQPGNALASFLSVSILGTLSGLFLWFGLDRSLSFYNSVYRPFGIICAGGAGVFYIANFYSAFAAATKFNRRFVEERLRRIEIPLLQVGLE